MPTEHELPPGPEPAELDLLAVILHPDTGNDKVLDSGNCVTTEDFGDPINRVVFNARMACATAGESGEAMLLARLRADGHLQRNVDGRVGVRLAELLTRRVDTLQLPALTVELLDRAECRLIAAHADMGVRVWDMPPQDRRDAMRAHFSAYTALTKRMDAAKARVGEPTSALKVVKSA